jgi:hypothetical protein
MAIHLVLCFVETTNYWNILRKCHKEVARFVGESGVTQQEGSVSAWWVYPSISVVTAPTSKLICHAIAAASVETTGRVHLVFTGSAFEPAVLLAWLFPYCAGFEVLTEVPMTSKVLWDATTFRSNLSPHLQGRKVSQARSQQKAESWVVTPCRSERAGRFGVTCRLISRFEE